jgi:hypothetical protein
MPKNWTSIEIFTKLSKVNDHSICRLNLSQSGHPGVYGATEVQLLLGFPFLLPTYVEFYAQVKF